MLDNFAEDTLSPYVFEEGSPFLTRKQRRQQKTMKPHKHSPIPSERHLASRQPKVVTPKTENQSVYMDFLKKRQLVIAEGSAGTGKTFLACVHAANKLLTNDVEQIILIRPYEHVGRSIGLRPGSSEEKLQPLMQAMLNVLEDVLGTSHFELCKKSKKIVMEALEDIRGRSYAKSILIVDEGQNIDVNGMKALLTRLEEDSQLVICGDTKQQDLKGASGLAFLHALLKKMKDTEPAWLTRDELTVLHRGIGHVEFTERDIVRSGLTKIFVKAFDNL